MTKTFQKTGRTWKSCKALLFDKDGTLINFRLLWLGWCREVIRALSPSYDPVTVEKCLAVWGVDLALGSIEPGGCLAIGSRLELQQSLAAELHDQGFCADEANAQVLLAMHQAYRAVEEKKLVQPIEGIFSTISDLHRRGYALAVVTTDDTAKANDNLKTLGLQTYFAVVIGCDKVASCKPAPDLVLEACRILKIKPDQAAVIGDTTADMIMGIAAGTACNIGVASGVTAPQTLAEHADLVLESAAEMARSD